MAFVFALVTLPLPLPLPLLVLVLVLVLVPLRALSPARVSMASGGAVDSSARRLVFWLASSYPSVPCTSATRPISMRASSFCCARSSSQLLRPSGDCSRKTLARFSATSGKMSLRCSSAGTSTLTATPSAATICGSVAQAGLANVTCAACRRTTGQARFTVRSP